MSFSCKIRLCYNNECSALTPPQCGASGTETPTLTTKEELLQDLDNDQLYGSSTPSTSTRSQTTEDSAEQTISTSSNELFSTITSAETNTVEPEQTVQTTTSKKTTRQPTTTTTTRRSGGGPSSTELAPDEDEQEDAQTTPLPSDFPRPASLLQQDDPLSGHGSGEALEDVVLTPAQSAQFVKTTAKKNQSKDLNDSSELIESEPESRNNIGTMPPVKILQRPSASKAASANAKNSAAMNRQQRDTTVPATKDSSIRRSVKNHQTTQFVDLDVNSPELTILDDNNLEPGTAERLSAAASSPRDLSDFNTHYQRDSTFFDFGNNQTSVCFSPTILALAGGLLTLLAVAIGFVLLKSRKTIHSFN